MGGALAALGVVRPKAVQALTLNENCPEAAITRVFSPNESLARKALELDEWRRSRKHRGFDPSVECLRSVSPAIKELIQSTRDEAQYTWMQRLRKCTRWGWE